MKTRFFTLLALMSLAAVAFVSSCQDDPLEPLNREEAKTRILNLLGPDQVDLSLETGVTEISFGSRIPFGGTYPDAGYATLITRTESETDSSQRAAVFLSANNTFSRDPILENELFFLNPNINTTIALVDSFDKAKLIRAADIIPEFTADTTAMLRFMNLAYHLPSVSMNDVDSIIMFDQYTALVHSQFTEVPAGTYNFRVIEDSSGFPIVNLPNTELEVGEVYNIWFTWRRGASVADIERLVTD